MLLHDRECKDVCSKERRRIVQGNRYYQICLQVRAYYGYKPIYANAKCSQLPCYDMILPALLENPLEELLDKCKMRPGMME